jgi:molecular chaperone DnaJ
MNLKDAYSILEIPQTSTPEEAKKKYRDLTKKFHPDINKEPGAEDKFKKINEAYQVVSTGKSTDRQQFRQTNTYNPFGRQNVIYADHINISTTISFKESIEGCNKEITFNRNVKCKPCGGQGESTINNGCAKCGGRGQVVMRQGNMVMVQTCDKCFGRADVESCSACNGEGFVQAETSITVNIQGGRNNGDTLRLAGMGNYVGNFGPIEQYTDAHLNVQVIPESGLSLDGTSVVCQLQLSLLEALKGCQKSVKTIDGETTIDIKPLSRHKEEVVLPKLGVNRQGDQRVILDIKYPDNIDNLINGLSKEI